MISFKRSCLFFTLLLTTFVHPMAQAASFNCLAKNLKSFEEKICLDGKLSLLDEQVSSYYEDTLQLSSKHEEIKKFQQDKMLERKKCKTTACLEKIYLASLAYLRNTLHQSLPPEINKSLYPVWSDPVFSDPDLKSCENKENADDIMCKAMSIMKQAKPARNSAVNDFSFTEKSIDLLPDFLRLEPGNGKACMSYNFNRIRIPMNKSDLYTIDFDDKIILSKYPYKRKITSTVLDKKQLLINFQSHNSISEEGKEFYGYSLNIKILGRGDLLNTGWESLLMYVTKTSPSFNGAYIKKLFILTRKKDSDVFQVANPEQYLSIYPKKGIVCAEVTYRYSGPEE